MGTYSTAFAISGGLTGLLLWMLHPLAYKLGLVDRPGGRKDHAHPTPIIGGVAIAMAIFATTLVGNQPWDTFAPFVAASMLLIVVGLLDDAYDLRWWWRVLSQVAAGLIMVYWGGVQVDYVGPIFTDSPIVLGAWAVPFTVFATVGIINAVNMSDGADGLAGSLCLVALVMLGAAALYAGNVLLFARLLPIMAAIGAFLAFNMRFPWQRRAKVFLGNAGSAFLGFTIAWVVFRLTQNAGHPVPPGLAPWLLAPPIIDCLVLIVRRLKLGRSPFHGDRDHMHHLLLDAGFTPTQVAVGLSALSLLLGLLAALVLSTKAGNETHLVVGFAVLTAGYYWLTADRVRAVRMFKGLRNPARPLRERAQPTVVLAPPISAVPQAHAAVARRRHQVAHNSTGRSRLIQGRADDGAVSGARQGARFSGDL
jgi:UDP-GlcNAc:undecaprenyl-phosphate GlcNAc-1-phosphate transferase